MTKHDRTRDTVYDPDRDGGSTAPEQGCESTSVVGRPAVERPKTAFHEPAETPELERRPFTEEEALEEGGSFDAVARPDQLEGTKPARARDGG